MIWALRRYLVEFVLLANAGAFGMILAELALTEHTEGLRIVAPVAALTGLVLSLLAIPLRGPARYATAVAFLLLSGTGFLGVAQHLGGDDDGRGFGFAAIARADDDEDDEREESEDDDGEAPPLAPLALTGSALLGALASLAGVPGRDEIRQERRL